MNHRQRNQNPRQWRRLPHVQRPHRSRPMTFWLSQQGAAKWLRKHQSVIETAVGLLEMYPGLVQITALDALWNFMAPFVNIYTEKKESSRQEQPVKGRENKQRKTGGASLPKLLSVGPVPAISITHDANEDENDLEEELLGRHLQGGLDDDDDDEEETETRTPHIYVCIHADTVGHDRQLYVRVIDALICDFFVMSGPRVESGELFSHDSVREKNLSQANACVFVLDGASLNDPECFRDLSAAWAMNLPMVFVKNSSFSLPSPLPDFVLQHSLGMESPAVSRAFTPAFPMRHSSVTPTSDVTPDARPGQLRRRRSFSSMRSASPRCHVTGNSRRSEKRGQQDFREADVVLTLLDGYRHALVFEDTAGDDCALALRRRLQSLLDARTRSVIATPAMSSNSNLHQVDANEFRHKESSKFLRVPEFFSGDLSPMTEFPKNSVALHKSANDSRSSSSCLALASKSVTSLPRESNTPLRGPELSTGCGLVDQRSRGQAYCTSHSISRQPHSNSHPISLQGTPTLFICPDALSPTCSRFRNAYKKIGSSS
ncbi:uncharacterized protein LOC112570070 isoform X2 [Pomacea canaliculata]|nr:uncharacterized protein LOC112570070 isoform X2 [Pomacea canaliculata]